MQIKNSVFLITGGASGLGAATARMPAENGAKVVIVDMQAEAGEKLARELGGRFAKADVASEADGKTAGALGLEKVGGGARAGELARLPRARRPNGQGKAPGFRTLLAR